MQVHCVDEEYAVEAQRTAARCVMVSSEATTAGWDGEDVLEPAMGAAELSVRNSRLCALHMA